MQLGCIAWLWFVLFPAGFLSALCLSSTTEQHHLSSSCPQYTQALLTHFLTALLPFLLVALKFCEYIFVSIFFAVWLLGEWTHHNCEDGVAGVAEPPKSLWRVFYKHGRCFQRIVWNSAVIQVQNLNWSTWSFSRICHIENAGEPWAEEWMVNMN